MIRILLLALALAGVSSAAQAQTAVQVIPTCGSAVAPVGPGGHLYTDTTGTLCTVGGSGGGGTTTVGSVTPAGSNGSVAQAVQGITGGVPLPVSGTVAATQSGTWNFGLSGPLPTGSNTIGAVTGTGTFAVQNTASIPAGSNAIGTVGVTALPALPAGTNTIGSIANISGTVSLPTGAATAANQSSVISAIGTTNTRSVVYNDATKASYGAGSSNFMPARSPTGVYTKFNVAAGCSQSATLLVRGSNDSFSSFVYLASSAITAATDSPTGAAVAGTSVTVPVGFASYQAIIVMGGTAGTCTVSSSLTAS